MIRQLQSIANHPRLGPWWRLMRFDKPVGTLLVLWPTLWGLWLAADGWPSLHLLLIFTLGSILMRAAGCAINDYADRNLDGEVERTRNRPLATGELTPKQALGCFFVLITLAFFLVLLTNLLTIMLAFVGVLLAATYPFLKRWTHLPQLGLGLAMNWGMVMAYAAQAGALSPGIFVFYCAAICWTVAYDTCYAMVDREDDLRIGIKSIAILFGEQDKLMIGLLQTLTIGALWIGAARFELGGWYLAMLAPLTGLFAYQQWLIRERSRSGCFAAFMNNRWVGPLVLLGIWLG